MRLTEVINISQYIIEEWLDVVITRIEWFEKILETEQLLLNA
ncbi:hypothetical protein SHELI_v1c01380 [Spiroplasma helicoides]|uniref:Uncharacterized protein n=1 Tax=Spiroplasma helicoides TaxID=216938 RepID=A0A1B3SJH8_9MOLU|nr:hypothetical protein [Spiroplasma helicoides]AOG60093.1 hypothetical protein SHELI_v1c01380 [Spiroplasma helicoides]